MLRHRSLVSGGSSLSRMPFASHIMRQASKDLGPTWGRVSSITIRHCARSRNFSTACHFLREKPSIRGVHTLRQKVGKAGGTPKEESKSAKNKNLSLILLSVIIGTVGLSYLSVPLYRLFCQQTGMLSTSHLLLISQMNFLRIRRNRQDRQNAKGTIPNENR